MKDEILVKLSEMTALQREMLANQANLQRTQEKHSELLETQGETLLRNTITVEQHERRSTNLEIELKRVDSDVEEIKEHVHNIQGIGKLIKWTSIIAGSITACTAAVAVVYKLIQFISTLG